jgi:hypothetical protein
MCGSFIGRMRRRWLVLRHGARHDRRDNHSQPVDRQRWRRYPIDIGFLVGRIGSQETSADAGTDIKLGAGASTGTSTGTSTSTSTSTSTGTGTGTGTSTSTSQRRPVWAGCEQVHDDVLRRIRKRLQQQRLE